MKVNHVRKQAAIQPFQVAEPKPPPLPPPLPLPLPPQPPLQPPKRPKYIFLLRQVYSKIKKPQPSIMAKREHFQNVCISEY